ncbi:MAG: ribonuclease HI family protein [Candidatus Micrarchaeaceae archaeon]
MLIYLYTDGAARGNPGKSASGYEIYDEKMNLMAKESLYNGIMTNNQAEYTAVIMALEKVSRELGLENELHIYSDSQLMIRQLKGEYKVKDTELKALHSKALKLLRGFKSFTLYNVPRENSHISNVDASLNELLDSLR